MKSTVCHTAFLDVLGFKDLVRNNSHEQLMRVYKKSFQLSVELGVSGGKFVPGKNANSVTADLSNAKVHSLLVSDSIILWSEDSSVEGFVHVVGAVKEMLNFAMINGVPLRGAVSCGELSFYDNSHGGNYTQSSLVGEGLVNAYEVENAQLWSGCAVDVETLLFKCSDQKEKINQTIEYLIQSGILVKYNIQCKKDHKNYTIAINWTKEDAVDEKWIRSSFAEHNKKIKDEKVETMIENTVEFYKKMRGV